MSMWMRMPGQSWPGAEASFLGMWLAMMVAMMLPSLLPILLRFRLAQALDLAAGYFSVWTALGAAIFPLGVALADFPWPAFTSGIVVLAAGALQFTAWKARHLAHCRTLSPKGGSAWRQGLLLGVHCCCGCAGPTAILLAAGVMEPWPMAAVTAAITAERLFPAGGRVVQATGSLAIGAGLVLLALH